jgi:uncharacterized pyridoxal phosphate-dependent enzyme
MKRRDLIKYLSVAPVAGAVVGSGAPFQSLIAAPARKAERDFIKELGLRTFINAAGTYTTHTASLMHPDTMAAINAASKQFVMIRDVQDAVGKKIAEICHAEAAMVTAGCWSAIVLGTAAALTYDDFRTKGPKLPDVSSFNRNEVIVQRGQNVSYVHAMTNTGIIPVVVDTKEELEKAITSKTALMYFLNEAQKSKNGVKRDIDPIMHEEFLAIAKKHNIPTLIDIAADVPPVENLWKFNEMGFSMVCVSGGKGLHGPQSAGILMGRKDLIAAARLNAPPDGNNIGRGMKVNKEEILGMYAALDAFVKQDHDKVWKQWEDMVAVINESAKKVKGVITEVVVPEIANHTPTLRIAWDQTQIKATMQEIKTRLIQGSPSIEMQSGNVQGKQGLSITVWMMQPGEEKIVGKRIQEELTKASVSS